MRFNTIPEELRQLNQWVCVSADSKVPQQALTLRPASSVNPATWSSFDDAVLSVKVGIHDYIGFVFADNGIVGIDIDDGFSPDGRLTELAEDILANSWSYTERSRSGRGFHIFVQGDIPFKGKNNLAGVEVYKTGRFFIMTGDVMFERNELMPGQNAIDYIIDKYFPETREKKSTTVTPRIYSPEWECPKGSKRVRIKPHYPTIPDGCRNICLTSLAGMMHSIGYSKGHIFRELQYANDTACNPPLPLSELRSICNSVTRYQR